LLCSSLKFSKEVFVGHNTDWKDLNEDDNQRDPNLNALVIIRTVDGEVASFSKVSEDPVFAESLISSCGCELDPAVAADTELLAIVKRFEEQTGFSFIPCAFPGQKPSFFVRHDVLEKMGAIIPAGSNLTS
jgi:hypothetical protein